MIASSGLAKAMAVSAAVVMHGTVVAVVFTGEQVRVEGATGGMEASIGSSFADMAAGVMTADAVEDVVEETSPEEVTRDVAPEDVAQAVAPETIAEPQTAEAVAPNEPEATLGETIKDAVAQTALAATVPLVPVNTSENAMQPQREETLKPVEEVNMAVARSLRPKARSAAFEKTHKRKPPKAVKSVATPAAEPKAKAQPKGNAQHDAKAGAATGTRTKTESAATGSGQKKAMGNAAASNYPGAVMRKISRVPRPRVGSTGTAVVAFRIAPNGGLEGVSISSSSGSSRLDQAAVKMIRRAAPFPPPPAGARRSFSIKIKGS